MAKQSFIEAHLKYEKDSIEQHYGPILDSTVKSLAGGQWEELEKISALFVDARSRYLNSKVLLKIMITPMLLLFCASCFKVVADSEFGFGLVFIPVVAVGLMTYSYWCRQNIEDKASGFFVALRRIEATENLRKETAKVGYEEYQLSDVGRLALENAIKGISLTRKAIPFKKMSSLLLGLGYGLVMGLIIAAIGVFLTYYIDIFDPMFESLAGFVSYVFFVMGLGCAALPNTEYNKLQYQLSGLIQDYCHYRDICDRFRIISVYEFDRRFVEEMIQPNLFSQIPADYFVYRVRQHL